jgi:hypothetical protein
VLVVEKGVPAAVVAAMEPGEPFIDAGAGRKRGKRREEAGRKCGNGRCRANTGDAWRLGNTDETSRLPLHRH